MGIYIYLNRLYTRYKNVKGKEVYKHAHSDEDLEAVKKEIGKGALIQRYKGLEK